MSDAVLRQAAQHETEYDWLAATESYNKALTLLPKYVPRKGSILEQLGFAYYKAAMQAETLDEFRDRSTRAVENYEKAKESYGKPLEPNSKAGMLRCEAMAEYVRHWLAPKATGKKKLLDQSWLLTQQALAAFEEAGESIEYGRTFNQLSVCVRFRFFLDWDFEDRKKMIWEAIEHGRKAIKYLSESANRSELARVYARTAALLAVYDYHFVSVEKYDRDYQEGLGYWTEAVGLSEDIALIEAIYPLSGPQIYYGLEATEEAFTNLTKALSHAKKTGDNFTLACALDWLAYSKVWKLGEIEDPDKRTALLNEALKNAEDAKKHYATLGFISPRGDFFAVEEPRGEYYLIQANSESERKKRRELLQKAREATEQGLHRTEAASYPELLAYMHHVAGKIFGALAKTETNPENKKQTLEEALKHRNDAIRLNEKFESMQYWNLGIQQTYLADIKSQLATLAEDPDARRKILAEAVADKENSIRLCDKLIPLFEKRGSLSLISDLAGIRWEYGELLDNLYELTNEKENLRKAVQAFREAAESFGKADQSGSVGGSHWQAAYDLDVLGLHLEAADEFKLASDYCLRAAGKIPQLRDYYQNFARYTQAWNEIEKARYHHARQEYDVAEEHFEKAAEIHKTLEDWNYFAPNYSAWAKVERAEDLSRKEQSEEALNTFEQAAKLFSDAQSSLKAVYDGIECQDEKKIATRMFKINTVRHDYCTARVDIEEAKILDKKGDHYASSKKYAQAAKTLEKIAETLETDEEGATEFQFILSLSRAWQKMMLAEAEASPELYVEASKLFEQAREFGPNEKAKMLVMGHSRFCRALEAGTRFADTRNLAMHESAIQHLESAANYYEKAGFQNASEYANATGSLFDAYVYMDNAKKEPDPEKKAKFYMMAEKVLQAAAGNYLRAEHPEKMEQVQKLLERVKKEQELAMSLTEVLHTPIVVSTTTFPAPASTSEKAVGLERFEYANVQANIITRQTELKIGEDFDMEIELVNAGRHPTLLIKIAEAFPKTFQLVEKPENLRVEGTNIILKGKRLDPLKTEDVKLTLKPEAQGEFQLTPRILYLDENGKTKTCLSEPVTVSVRELGISGWLKGPGKPK